MPPPPPRQDGTEGPLPLDKILDLHRGMACALFFILHDAVNDANIRVGKKGIVTRTTHRAGDPLVGFHGNITVHLDSKSRFQPQLHLAFVMLNSLLLYDAVAALPLTIANFGTTRRRENRLLGCGGCV